MPTTAPARTRLRYAAQLTTAALVLSSVSLLASVAPAQAASPTFSSPSGTTWTVPEGVTSVKVSMTGASGGGKGDGANNGAAGFGGQVDFTLAVSAGQSYTLYGSTQGADAGPSNATNAGGSGYRAGGSGRAGDGSLARSGAGGGGASAIVRGGTVIAVAGGGGGGGGLSGAPSFRGGNGGSTQRAGSAASGHNGGQAGGQNGALSAVATGATQLSGSGRAGEIVYGGSASGGAGGGGGGYRGGNGARGNGGSSFIPFVGTVYYTAGGNGGGAGSSFVGSGTTGATTASRTSHGNGAVTLTYASATITSISGVTNTSATVSVATNDNSGTPTGTVTLSTTAPSVRILATATLVDGRITLNFEAPLPVGTTALKATYTPTVNSSFITSTGTGSLTRAMGSLTTTLGASATNALTNEAPLLSFSSSLDQEQSAPAASTTVTIYELAPGSTTPNPATDTVFRTMTGYTPGSTRPGSSVVAAGQPARSFYAVVAASATHERSISNIVTVNFYDSFPTTTTLKVTPEGALNVDSSLSFTAAVTPAVDTAQKLQGSVIFTLGGVDFAPMPLTTAGTATLTLGKSSPRTTSVSARFVPENSHFAASAAEAQNLDITRITTATTLSVSPDASSTYGTELTLSAVVTAGGAPVSGRPVVFKNGTQVLGVSGTNNAGKATFTVQAPSVGVMSLTAAADQSNRYSASTSAAISHDVNRAPSTTTLTAPATAQLGNEVTFTATVAAGDTVLDGPVGFFDGDKLLHVATSTNGVATFTSSTLALGEHSITADFAGNETHNGSSSEAIALEILKRNSALDLSVAPAGSSTIGDDVVLTAELTGSAITVPTPVETAIPAPTHSSVPAPTSSNTPTPGNLDGEIEFFDGETSLGTATSTGGIATLTVNTLPVGTHALRAVFTETATHQGAETEATSHEVAAIGTSLALTIPVNQVNVGQDVTVHADVTSANGHVRSPEGSVIFTIDDVDQDPVTVEATGDGIAHASLTVENAAHGSHDVTARFVPAADFTASETSATSFNVSSWTTALTITLKNTAPVAGDTLNFDVTVRAQGSLLRMIQAANQAPVPTGAVHLVVNGVTGDPITLDENGDAEISVSAPEAGELTIRAVFAPSTLAVNEQTSEEIIVTVADAPLPGTDSDTNSDATTGGDQDGTTTGTDSDTNSGGDQDGTTTGTDSGTDTDTNTGGDKDGTTPTDDDGAQDGTTPTDTNAGQNTGGTSTAGAGGTNPTDTPDELVKTGTDVGLLPAAIAGLLLLLGGAVFLRRRSTTS